jgi:signal transduction histidine kinase
MSFLEIIQLIGYSFGSTLHLWIGMLLIKQRTSRNPVERVLLALAVCTGIWHATNLLIALHALLGLSALVWSNVTRIVECGAIICITLCYSLLLHVHLHLWANARHRALNNLEQARVYLSYLPLVFLIFAVPAVWSETDATMFGKLTGISIIGSEWNFVVAFAWWAAYVLVFVGVTDLIIARKATEQSERFFMRTLAVSFFSIAILILCVHALGWGAGTASSEYLQTLANLGSLLPTALLAYYIYRYRYLEIIIRDSLAVAIFAVVILVIYLYGIRALGEIVTVRYGLRPGVVESMLILALALVAAPLRLWLEHRFNNLFSRETTLYRDVLVRIGLLARETRRYKQLPQLLDFVAERSEKIFGLRRVRFHVSILQTEHAESGAEIENALSPALELDADWTAQIMRELSGQSELKDSALLLEHKWNFALALRRENETLGLMLVDAESERLTSEVRQALAVLAGQVALAVAECRLVEENIQLERRLAHGERLAALGRMAATVAHEIKNPLSAIKSIAQVMREDGALAVEYARDLDLIVGETDRLSRSVTQLLNWSRRPAIADVPAEADEVIRGVLRLLRHESDERNIEIVQREAINVTLDGAQTAALHDVLSNLLLNALQATPAGKIIEIETRVCDDNYIIRVTDGGAGVPADLRERIWEPFFTTKQRGTGLGLAIVRKRLEEVGGSTRLVTQANGATGACFESRLPLAATSNSDERRPS